MRRTARSTALVAILLLCLAAPVAAQGVVRLHGTDLLPQAPNPCTGQLEDIHFSAMVTLREAANMVMFHAVGTATQGDFSGPVVTRFTDTWSGDRFVSTFNSNVTMFGPDGRTIKGRFLFHTVWEGDQLKLDIVRVDLTCAGSSA